VRADLAPATAETASRRPIPSYMNPPMQRTVTLAFCGLIGVSFWSFACAPQPRRLYTGPGVEAPRAEQDLNALIDLHNKVRAEAKLPPLAANPEVKAAAKLHARDMADHEKMSHTGSDKSSPFDRLKTIGYQFRSAAENVAYGQASVDEVMRSWINSRPHRKNVLGDFTEIGAAVAYSKEGTPYWCVVFGRPWSRLDPAKAAEETIEHINAARAKNERSPLKAAALLAKAALQHARELAKRGELTADDEKNQKAKEKELTAVDRAAQAESGRYQSLSESDASGEDAPEELIDHWLEDGDRKKVLLGDCDEVGVGYAPSRDGRPFWCILFGKLIAR
jgi:uncharacterized protein YkwD